MVHPPNSRHTFGTPFIFDLLYLHLSSGCIGSNTGCVFACQVWAELLRILGTLEVAPRPSELSFEEWWRLSSTNAPWWLNRSEKGLTSWLSWDYIEYPSSQNMINVHPFFLSFFWCIILFIHWDVFNLFSTQVSFYICQSCLLSLLLRYFISTYLSNLIMEYPQYLCTNSPCYLAKSKF